METIDDDIAGRAVDYIKRQAQAGQPFFLWVNFTHMHFRTHVKPESRGQSGRWQSEYHDVMIDHDKNVGTVLKALDDAGIADNTFVMYSTDNGPNMFSWPDGAMTPFRNEKNTNWEGAYRVPCVVRWPGKIKPGTVSNEIVAHHDWLPTFLAMAGDAEVKDKLLKGYTIGDMTYKVHLDGYNLVPYLTGEAEKSPRVSFIYCNDDQQVVALRYDNWKIVFAEQRAPGTLRVWAEPFVTLRVPKIFNLRTDPFERADITSITYYDWLVDHVYLLVPAQAYIGEFLQTFREYPQRQKAASFNLDDVLRRLQESKHYVTQPNRIEGGRPVTPAGRPVRSLERPMEEGRGQTHMARRREREHLDAAPIRPTRCALFTRATRIRRRSATSIGTASSIGTRIGVGHCPFCCGRRRSRGQIERSWSPAAERPRPPSMRCASLMRV